MAAAAAVAREVGLKNVEPVVLHLSGRTTLRLAPFPIVARVLSAFSLEGMTPAVRRELRVAEHLAARAAPTVRPTTDPSPGPYVIGEATVTLWTLVEHRKAKDRADALAAGQALAAVHTALSDFPGRLPSFTQDFDSCTALLADANELRTLADDDRTFVASRLDALRRSLTLDRSRFIPLHGDAHLGNVLMTKGGAVWADLESVCRGPLEWDLTSLPHAARAAFPALDRPLFRQLSLLRSTIVVVWCAYHAERSPQLRAAGAYHLRRLRRLS